MNSIYTDSRIDELYSFLSLSHAQNINVNAFNDISNVLFDFYDKRQKEGNKHVCIASMGHGKTTVLISFLKWAIKQKEKQPILLSVREKQLASVIYNEIVKESPESIINVDSDNKNMYESDLYKYQIVIIQHQRLKNLCLGYGNLYEYTYFEKYKHMWGKSNAKEKMKRLLIIDEKPDFIDSAIFDITKDNNVLEWFDDLALPFRTQTRTLQKHKSYITFLLQEELADNTTDVTNALFKKEDLNSKRSKELLKMLNEMKDHPDNKTKYESLNKLKHFKNLLINEGYGRIDDYSYGAAGRKVIVSKYIDYSILRMNFLIFDGTGNVTKNEYIKGKIKATIIENRNDYTRLILHQDKINTSKYSRSKDDHPTQKTISNRIKELKEIHKDLFVLPMKEDIPIYMKENIIDEKDKYLYYDDIENNTIGINLLNTIGKNMLNNKTSLYLTCLPKRHADYYKCIAIAIYDHDVSLLTSDETDNSNWFQDELLEEIYKRELYAELLQIIHRTVLRKIDNKDKINIYIAFDDERKYIYDFNTYTHAPIYENMNINYLKNEAVITPINKLIDMTLYNRNKTLDGFIEQINKKFNNSSKNEIRISQVSSTFSKFIRRHWTTKQLEINNYLHEHSLQIIEKKDRYSNNSKYVVKI